MSNVGLFSRVSNFVSKNPKLVKCATSTGIVGTAGLLAFAVATSFTKKEERDISNRLVLTNPVLNPLGWGHHLFNPKNKETGVLDSPIVKYIVDKNNKEYDEYYSQLTPAEKVEEFYQNGGKGVRFNK